MPIPNDPAYGPQSQPIDPAVSASNPFGGFQSDLGGLQSSSNTLAQIAAQLGGAGALPVGLGSEQQAAAEQGYLSELANSALGSQYAGQQAGYQLGELGLSSQELGVKQLGVTQEQQLQGVEQPIQTSELTGGLAAQGALNTKGSGQQQTQLGAEQQYTNEQLANAQKTLGLMASANGVSTQEVTSQLNYALQQAGLSNQMSAVDLLNQIGQIQSGELTGLENVISPLVFAGGLNAFSGGSTPVGAGVANSEQQILSILGGL